MIFSVSSDSLTYLSDILPYLKKIYSVTLCLLIGEFNPFTLKSLPTGKHLLFPCCRLFLASLTVCSFFCLLSLPPSVCHWFSAVLRRDSVLIFLCVSTVGIFFMGGYIIHSTVTMIYSKLITI